MTERLQIYKCEVCGNIVEVLHEGAGELVCCGQPMTLLAANTVDAAKEKHVPVIEKTANGVTVKRGSAPHPQTDKLQQHSRVLPSHYSAVKACVSTLTNLCWFVNIECSSERPTKQD